MQAETAVFRAWSVFHPSRTVQPEREKKGRRSAYLRAADSEATNFTSGSEKEVTRTNSTAQDVRALAAFVSDPRFYFGACISRWTG